MLIWTHLKHETRATVLFPAVLPIHPRNPALILSVNTTPSAYLGNGSFFSAAFCNFFPDISCVISLTDLPGAALLCFDILWWILVSDAPSGFHHECMNLTRIFPLLCYRLDSSVFWNVFFRPVILKCSLPPPDHQHLILLYKCSVVFVQHQASQLFNFSIAGKTHSRLLKPTRTRHPSHTVITISTNIHRCFILKSENGAHIECLPTGCQGLHHCTHPRNPTPKTEIHPKPN